VRAVWLGWLPPVVLFLAMAAAPFVYRAWSQPRAAHVTKIALLVAFSGQLAARGNDLYAAAEIAGQHTGGARTATIAAISALDDRGQAQSAKEQARGAAADPAIRAVVCCSSVAAERAVAPVLPRREVFYSLGQAAAPTAEEAELARQGLGGTTAVVISDRTTPQDNRSTTLTADFAANGYAVTTVAVDLTAGSALTGIAASVARERPDLIVLDMEYPAAAVVGDALRHAAVTAPLLGDDRLDGAPAAALLGGLGALWYVAPDRNALLQQAPATFVGDFARLRGHQPSSRDILAYLQTRAALLGAPDQVQTGRLPPQLYHLTSGVYPGLTVSTSRGAVP
jgi:ABC-type branched-subunit amino acid transport system substrate-binding protein